MHPQRRPCEDKRPWKFAEVPVATLLFWWRPFERSEKYEGSQRCSCQGGDFIVEAGYIRRGDAGEIGWRQQKR